MEKIFIVCLLTTSTPVFDSSEVTVTGSGTLSGWDIHHQLNRFLPREVYENRCFDMDSQSASLLVEMRQRGFHCTIQEGDHLPHGRQIHCSLKEIIRF